MYLLTLLGESNRPVQTIDFDQPPTSQEIDEAMADNALAVNFDISRKPLEDIDFEELHEDDLEAI